jgi:hypothetical protein
VVPVAVTLIDMLLHVRRLRRFSIFLAYAELTFVAVPMSISVLPLVVFSIVL